MEVPHSAPSPNDFKGFEKKNRQAYKSLWCLEMAQQPLGSACGLCGWTEWAEIPAKCARCEKVLCTWHQYAEEGGGKKGKGSKGGGASQPATNIFFLLCVRCEKQHGTRPLEQKREVPYDSSPPRNGVCVHAFERSEPGGHEFAPHDLTQCCRCNRWICTKCCRDDMPRCRQCPMLVRQLGRDLTDHTRGAMEKPPWSPWWWSFESKGRGKGKDKGKDQGKGGGAPQPATYQGKGKGKDKGKGGGAPEPATYEELHRALTQRIADQQEELDDTILRRMAQSAGLHSQPSSLRLSTGELVLGLRKNFVDQVIYLSASSMSMRRRSSRSYMLYRSRSSSSKRL